MTGSEPVDFGSKLPACFGPNDPAEAELITRFIRAESQLWPDFLKYSGVQVSMKVRTFLENQRYPE